MKRSLRVYLIFYITKTLDPQACPTQNDHLRVRELGLFYLFLGRLSFIQKLAVQ